MYYENTIEPKKGEVFYLHVAAIKRNEVYCQ